MSFKKILAVAAVTGLVIAMALPALALENEFHGMFRASGISSNFLNGGSGPAFGITALPPTNLLAYSPGTKSYVDQRARLQYTAKANDDLKLVTHFEIDSRWGDSSYNAARNQGGALGADQINLETKSVYLDFNCPITGANFKVGMQPIIDSYKGLYFNADAAGALASKKFGDLTTTAGFFRFDDARAAGTSVGRTTRDFVLADAKYSVSKDLQVGGSYYYYQDDKSVATAAAPSPFLGKEKIHNVGVNAQAVMGPSTVDAFFLYQNGSIETPIATHTNAFAGNLGAKVKAGPGTVKTNFLYVSGSKGTDFGNSFIPVTNETSNAYGENSFYDAGMALLMRGKYGMSNSDQAIVYDSGNLGQGIIAGFVGYDMVIDKFIASANAGFLAAAKDNKALKTIIANNKKTLTPNSSDYMGTELNAEVGYKVYDNLTASVQGAYVFLGDYFKESGAGGKDPDSPFLARVMLNYTF